MNVICYWYSEGRQFIVTIANTRELLQFKSQDIVMERTHFV